MTDRQKLLTSINFSNQKNKIMEIYFIYGVFFADFVFFYTRTEVYDQWTSFIANKSHALNINPGWPGQSFQLEPIGDDE